LIAPSNCSGTALAGSHPDVEITPVRGPAATTYRGHEGMRRFWEDIIEAFPYFSTEVVEARDLGDLVVGIVRIRGQGAGSKESSEQTVWYASAWRDRKLLWYCAYDSEARSPQSRRATGVGDVAERGGRPEGPRGVYTGGFGECPIQLPSASRVPRRDPAGHGGTKRACSEGTLASAAGLAS
jgi:hypothetical protein